MNITLKPATENQPVNPEDNSIDKLVEKFINGNLQEAIVSRKNGSVPAKTTALGGPFKGCKVYSVNVEVPVKAYQKLELFYKLCIDTLTPLGYHAEGSHDGGGRYSTLYVTWKSK